MMAIVMGFVVMGIMFWPLWGGGGRCSEDKIVTPEPEKAVSIAETNASPAIQTPTKTSTYHEIEVKRCRLRAQPSTDASKLKTVQKGVRCELLDAQDDWFEVMCEGTHGFVHADCFQGE